VITGWRALCARPARTRDAQEIQTSRGCRDPHFDPVMRVTSCRIAGAPLKSMKASVPTRVENSYFS